MNTRVKKVETPDEYECYFRIWCSTFRNIGIHVRTSIANKHLRVKNWNMKFDPIFKAKGENVYSF